MDARIFIKEFPKPDGEAKTSRFNFGGGGSAANVAVGASRLGVKSGFIGSLGFDTFGKALLAELESEGVDVTHVKIDPTIESGLTFIVINKRGQVMMFGYTGASDKLFPSDLDKDYISSAEHLHITGLSFDTTLQASKIGKKSGTVVSFDPGRLMSKVKFKKISQILEHVDQILLNHEEAKNLTGKDNYEISAKILLQKGPKIVIIKRGSKGVFAMTAKNKFNTPAYPVNVLDTTGAGDAFSAGFITAKLEGKSLEDSIKFANATASLKIKKIGARSLPSRKDVEKFLRFDQINLQ